mmetsp:Transcript_2147/g.6096  ORF Transcript_2147/g.6096 Transcript_2147/m.6096 type:complete len:201 (-) Transcript_2147:109-711(-)
MCPLHSPNTAQMCPLHSPHTAQMDVPTPLSSPNCRLLPLDPTRCCTVHWRSRGAAIVEVDPRAALCNHFHLLDQVLLVVPAVDHVLPEGEELLPRNGRVAVLVNLVEHSVRVDLGEILAPELDRLVLGDLPIFVVVHVVEECLELVVQLLVHLRCNGGLLEFTVDIGIRIDAAGASDCRGLLSELDATLAILGGSRRSAR